MRHRATDGEIGDARLNPRVAVGEVHLDHVGELGHTDHHRILLRNGAAGERRPGAACDHLDAVLVAEAHHVGDFLSRARQGDGERHLAIGGQRVGVIGAAFILGSDEAFGRQQSRKPGDDLVASRENAGVGFGKGDRHGVLPFNTRRNVTCFFSI